MPDDDSQEITQYLKQWGAGDRQALEQILPLVYHDLRTIARHQMSRERPAIRAQHGGQWKDRAHFFAFAAMMMRRILTDYARLTNTEKRGRASTRVPLSDELP